MADSQRKTANLFDVSQLSLRNGYAINDNGVEIESQYTGYTLNHISCKQETQYVLSYLVSSANNGYYRVYFYDEDDNFISRTSSYVPTAMPFEMHITTPSNATSFAIQYAYGGVTNNWNDLMINTGSTALPYEPYGWLHSLRKLTTATANIEPTIYSDGTAITAYTIKGNTTQSGTPTPSNPVDVNGVGVRTAQLFDKDNATVIGSYIASETGVLTYSTTAKSVVIPCQANTTYTLSKTKGSRFTVGCYDSNPSNGDTATNWTADHAATSITITTTANSQYLVVFFYYTPSETETYEQVLATLMMNTGSTAKPYELYGYKIPISSGQQTTNIDLGSTQTVRQIKKIVFDGTENWKFGAYPYLDLWRTIEPDYLREKINICYCSHLQTSTNIVNGESVVSNTCCFNIEDEAGVLYYKDTSVSDLASFKSYLAAQYANGTPVTVWYVLETPQTAAVNEPLMKIGTYADTLSNAAQIPTTEGANSISVDTAVQPSEFTATWTGWHDASVKEKSRNLFDKDNAERFEYGLGQNNTVGYSANAAMFCFEAEPNTDYSAKIYGSAETFIRLYRSNNELVKPESEYEIEYDSMVAQSSTQYPEVTINSGNCQYIWLQVSGSWYTTYGGGTIMLNTGSTALPYEPYWK